MEAYAGFKIKNKSPAWLLVYVVLPPDLFLVYFFS